MQIKPISTLPQNKNDTYGIWLYHLEVIEENNTKLTWNTPIKLLKHKISSPMEVELDAVLSILNNHIPKWRIEQSPNITHFQTIIDHNMSYKSILLRTLYECMDKNELNKDFIKSNSYSGFMFDSNFVTCNELLKRGQYKELDTLVLTKEYLNCLTDSPYTLLKLFKIYLDTEVYENKLNLHDRYTKQLITSIFANPVMYTNLIQSVSLPDNPDMIYYLKFLLNNKNYNSLQILNCFDTLFKTKEEQLCCLAGLSSILQNASVIEDSRYDARSILQTVTKMLEHKYPNELKVMNMFQSLGVTEFDIILDSLLQRDSINKIKPIELPVLF